MSKAATWSCLVALTALFALAPPAMAAIEVAGLTHLDGTAVDAGEVSENAIFVVFSSWSPKCRDIVERVNDIHAEWGGKARVFLVNFQEDRAAVNKFLANRSLKVDVLLDLDAAFSKKHKITYLPSLLAVKDGNAAFRGKLPVDIKPVLRPIFD